MAFNYFQGLPPVVIPPSTRITRLSHRSLVSVKGPDGSSLLQGLVTVDIPELQLGGSVYSMFLNAQVYLDPVDRQAQFKRLTVRVSLLPHLFRLEKYCYTRRRGERIWEALSHF